MRNIYKTLCLAAGLVAMTHCSDFLDQTSPLQLDNKTTFNNTYYTELTVNKITEVIQDQAYSNFMPIIAGLNTDCELVDGLVPMPAIPPANAVILITMLIQDLRHNFRVYGM